MSVYGNLENLNYLEEADREKNDDLKSAIL